MQDCRILFQDHGSTLDIRVQGRGTMRESVALKRLIEARLAAGAASVCLRLDECTYMDSTFVGTIIFVLRSTHQRRDFRLTVASPSEPCRDLLRNMRLDTLLNIEESAPVAGGAWRPLEEDRDVDKFESTVLSAHEALAGLPGDVGQTFQPIAERMHQEMKAAKPTRESGRSPTPPTTAAGSPPKGVPPKRD